jgi:hypothetical protein
LIVDARGAAVKKEAVLETPVRGILLSEGHVGEAA